MQFKDVKKVKCDCNHSLSETSKLFTLLIQQDCSLFAGKFREITQSGNTPFKITINSLHKLLHWQTHQKLYQNWNYIAVLFPVAMFASPWNHSFDTKDPRQGCINFNSDKFLSSMLPNTGIVKWHVSATHTLRAKYEHMNQKVQSGGGGLLFSLKQPTHPSIWASIVCK
jgi:hypothetical protein